MLYTMWLLQLTPKLFVKIEVKTIYKFIFKKLKDLSIIVWISLSGSKQIYGSKCRYLGVSREFMPLQSLNVTSIMHYSLGFKSCSAGECWVHHRLTLIAQVDPKISSKTKSIQVQWTNWFCKNINKSIRWV